MYLVRVNHKNGLYLEFLFMDPGRARSCAEECAAARLLGNNHPPKVAACEILDDTGRVTWLDGTQMQSVQFVPLEDEVRFNTRLKLVAEMTASKYLQEMGFGGATPVDPGTNTNGRAPPPQPDPDDRPSIGAFSA